MGATSIEWTDFSWNPIRARRRDGAPKSRKGGYGSGVGHYCEKLSPGCALCYSSTSQPRFGMPEFPGARKLETLPVIGAGGAVSVSDQVEVFLDAARLREPLTWRTPRKVFVCDMTDLFGPWVPDAFVDKVFAVMALTPHHTYQVLTKRPERMAAYLLDDTLPGRLYRLVNDWLDEGAAGFLGRYWNQAHNVTEWRTDGDPTEPEWNLPLPEVWLGTSIEDQKRADERIPHLLRCPAAVRFLSCEPLLGPIDLRDMNGALSAWRVVGAVDCVDPGGIDWVIVGGESGHGARPCQVEWVRSLVEQCRDAGVSCFVKQLGARPVAQEGVDVVTTCDGDRCTVVYKAVRAKNDDFEERYELAFNDRKGGDPAEWPEYLRVREFPKATVTA
jgi:protein gp37